MNRRLLIIGLLATTAIAVGAIVTITRGTAAGSSDGLSAAVGWASFSQLAAQHTNSCGLQASELATYSEHMRLQGACCTAMDETTYDAKLAGLRAYAGVAQIPQNPYDITVSLARRLVGYQRTIHLTPGQEGTYSAAMRMSSEKGPCCCHCWRWTAFQGMSDYLIARRGWRARPLAHLIGLVDGCGGKADVSGRA
jgi:hypothetical protein